MENKKVNDSKYGKKLAARRSADAGKLVPMPRPFSTEYFPNYQIKTKGMQENNTHKRENTEMLARFRSKDVKYPLPKFRRREMFVKYDHHAMNYSGWNG